MFDDVKEKLKALGISPIFFVGSGLSRRYINSPDWLGLLKETMSDTGINFTKYQQRHTIIDSSTGEKIINFEELAKELEEVYFDKLPEDKLEEGKNQGYYYRKKISDIVSKYLDDNRCAMLANKEVKELQKTTPAAIITTNYDEMLETIFGDEYTPHVGQTSLLTSVVDGVGDIYKIHGSVTDCDSIVITKDDYDRFFSKEIYLNSKILTLFLEYPIVFLGYSINDRNVKSILSTIFDTLSSKKMEELKSRMWFVTRADDGDDKVENKRINLNDGNFIDIKSFELNDFGDFYKAINDMSIKRLPIRFLKYLKHNTYQLVASQEYDPKLLDVNIEQIEQIKDFNEGNNFVGLSFSVKKRKSIPTKLELWQAFIDDKEADYDVYSILRFKAESRNKKIPFYKFIKNLKKEEILDYVECEFGKDSELYKLMIEDDKDYTKNIGVNMDVSDYSKEISIDNIEKYADAYMKREDVLFNQRGTIIRYVLLELIKQDVKKISSMKDLCTKYWKELSLVITNLSENYINENVKEFKKILKVVSKDRLEKTEIKNLICFLDKIIYRPQIMKSNN
ncbi:hypothetical protein DWV13_13370 [Clostridium botulinum]|uniref:SIR2 family protein n=1 Tax=Clostridium TaxID=1485 RepID=UPI0013F07400|nr:SIR2 family protein [Clostridium botulinum]MCS6132608.1 hypothetical protein [Clostridium botulinum]NFL45710.1 hypothetical protein [Clostridium botulinum]NFL89219.1 hypothetical protein [Clostridium botulinum]NFO33408.1 hypothetical protein [Clostridium botulinum]